MRAKESISVRVLVVTYDFHVIEALSHFAQSLAIHIESCCDADTAMGKLCHLKYEGVIVDLGLPGGLELLRKLPSLTSNGSAISYAILSENHDQAEAFRGGAQFVLDRPLIPVVVQRLFKASYPFMVHEKRRYFRCPLNVAVFVSRQGGPEFTVTSLNVSESGICINSPEALQVGDHLRLRLLLPGEAEFLRLSGEVVWSAFTGRAGVRFYDAKASVLLALRGWLAERLAECMAQHPDQAMA